MEHSRTFGCSSCAATRSHPFRYLCRVYIVNKQAFRPRARLLELLGEQLIDNVRLAVFEMVKNSYDADANQVTVCLLQPDSHDGTISVHDDGCGMTLDTIQKVWLEPGADDRYEQKMAGIRSEKFNRLPLGEKGVGRFAAHKLGNKICLWTRASGGPEFSVEIDWSEQIKHRYMDETEITISETSGIHFGRKKTGTRIEVSDLKFLWTRGDVRRLWNNVTSITAPYITKDDFDVTLQVPKNKDWLRGLLTAGDIIDSALWSYKFTFDEDGYKWEYAFNPPKFVNLEGASSGEKSSRLPFPKTLSRAYYQSRNRSTNSKNPVHVPASFCEGIGPVCGTLSVFDRDREILPLLNRPSQIIGYLDEHGGIRVYRGDIRVYSYGEPGNDWLGLDLRRVNQPTRAVSNNNIMGIITLDDSISFDLREKTSRDGFDNNQAFRRLRVIVLSAISHMESQRTVDKNRMRRVLEGTSKTSRVSPSEAITELKAYVKKNKLSDRLLRIVDKIEKRVDDMQDTLLRPGATQMHVATIFHEVDTGIRALHAAIHRGDTSEVLEQRSTALVELLDSFSNFFRKTPAEKLRMSELVELVLQINGDRFRRHKILVRCGWKTKNSRDFYVHVPKNIVMGAISNVIDNSIYWLDQRWSDSSDRRRRSISLTFSGSFSEGPALIMADNGPGYRLTPEDVLQPFVTLKPEGMGIGMYYCRLVMEALGGYVAFPSQKDVGLGRNYDGAVTAFVFPCGEWMK